MSQTDKVREYYSENPDLLDQGDYHIVAKLLGVGYDSVRKTAKKLRRNVGQQAQKGTGKLGGTLIRAKTWQLPNGEWRESLTYTIDQEKKWKEFKECFFKELKTVKPKTVKHKLKKNGVCLEISLPDLHVGKGDTDVLISKFTESCLSLLKRAEIYEIERIVFPIGNDGLNSEGKRYSTTAGTPQRDSIDWQDSFRIYANALIHILNEFSKVYPVDVIVIPGNHDSERMFYIGEVLSAYYMQDANVDIRNSGEYRHYYEYGINMLLFTHGDKEKLADLPLIMATEQPEMFARTKYREVHMGHFHKEIVNEFRGIKTRFLPSLCHIDEWHKMKGYAHQKSAQAYVWNKTNGLDGYFQINHFD